MSMMATADPNYHRDYYEANKEGINAKRRQRYADDPEYAAKQRAAARARHERLKAEGTPRKRKKKAKVDPAASKSRRQEAVWTRKMSIVVGGRNLAVTMHTLGYLADRLGRSIQGLRQWETAGILPKAMYRDNAKRRLYTSYQVDAIADLHEQHFPDGAKKRRRIKGGPFQRALHQLWTDMPQGVPV